MKMSQMGSIEHVHRIDAFGIITQIGRCDAYGDVIVELAGRGITMMVPRISRTGRRYWYEVRPIAGSLRARGVALRAVRVEATGRRWRHQNGAAVIDGVSYTARTGHSDVVG